MKRPATASAVILVLLLVFSAWIAAAAEVQRYSKGAFQQAQAAGKPIVVFVTASWCPNCRKQQPVVDTMAKDKAFDDAVLFVVNVDSDKGALTWSPAS